MTRWIQHSSDGDLSGCRGSDLGGEIDVGAVAVSLLVACRIDVERDVDSNSLRRCAALSLDNTAALVEQLVPER